MKPGKKLNRKMNAADLKIVPYFHNKTHENHNFGFSWVYFIEARQFIPRSLDLTEKSLLELIKYL